MLRRRNPIMFHMIFGEPRFPTRDVRRFDKVFPTEEMTSVNGSIFPHSKEYIEMRDSAFKGKNREKGEGASQHQADILAIVRKRGTR